MQYFKTVSVLSILLFTSTIGFANYDGDYDPDPACKYLYVDVTNATGSSAQLVGDPEYARRHGYIFRRASQVIPNGLTQFWTMHDNPLAGPEGLILYNWRDLNGIPRSCEIYYNQSFCGLISAGTNTTKVKGSCTVYNDPNKPSAWWQLHGESQVTLR